MFTVKTGCVEEAIKIMREVSRWGQARGLRVWPLDWLTPEELLTPDAPPESFCVGYLNGEAAGCMILQWQDQVWWPEAPYGQAAYLHKLCVRRPFAGMGIRIVKKVEYENGRGMLLYEAPVQPGLVPLAPAAGPLNYDNELVRCNVKMIQEAYELQNSD